MDQVVAQVDELIAEWETAHALGRQPCHADFRSLSSSVAPERYTHLVHSYPAKLLTHIPSFFLRSKSLTPRGDNTVVGDPFCGSGTVLLEALIKGFDAVGSDTNPLARLISRVKTTPLDTGSMRLRLADLKNVYASVKRPELPRVVNLAKWYPQPVAIELGRIRSAILQIAERDAREFMQVCLSSTVRKMSYADPRVSVPVRINPLRQEKYGRHFAQLERHLADLTKTNVWPAFEKIALRNLRRFDELSDLKLRQAQIHESVGAFGLSQGQCIDLIISSPPYLGAQKYIRASSLGLGWLDLAYDGQLRDLERTTIGREHFNNAEMKEWDGADLGSAGKVVELAAQKNFLRAHIARTYLVEMEAALRSMYRSLLPGGNLILVTGANTLCGYVFDTPRYLQEIALRTGFKSTFSVVDHIRSRGLMTKRHPNASLIKTECILGFRKT